MDVIRKKTRQSEAERRRLLALHLASLPADQRDRIETMAQALYTAVKKENPSVRFSVDMAIETLYAIGGLYREPWRRWGRSEL